MRNELILLVTYIPRTKTTPTSKILRIRKSTLTTGQLEHYHQYLNLMTLLRQLLGDDEAIILHINVLNQVEEFLLKL